MPFSDAQERRIQNDDVMSTAREKRKRDSIRRETVLGDKELDGSLNQGARTIEERRLSGGIGFRVLFASGDTFTQKKEMKERKSDFAGVRADSETTNRNRTRKWSRLLSVGDDVVDGTDGIDVVGTDDGNAVDGLGVGRGDGPGVGESLGRGVGVGVGRGVGENTGEAVGLPGIAVGAGVGFGVGRGVG